MRLVMEGQFTFRLMNDSMKHVNTDRVKACSTKISVQENSKVSGKTISVSKTKCESQETTSDIDSLLPQRVKNLKSGAGNEKNPLEIGTMKKSRSKRSPDKITVNCPSLELLGGALSTRDLTGILSNFNPASECLVKDGGLFDIEYPIRGLEYSVEKDSNSETCFGNDEKMLSDMIMRHTHNIFYSPPVQRMVERRRKKLLILDINGLLADIVSPPPKGCKADRNISRNAVFRRPFYGDFLNFCFEKFDVGIWSSRTRKNVEKVVDYLLGDMKHKLLFCWDLSHCTTTQFKTLENRHKALVFKEVRRLWEKADPSLPWEKGDYNDSNTLLLDDSPYKALLNPPNTGIFPLSYSFHNKGDVALGDGGELRVYLEELASSNDVQKYVAEHPFGQGEISERSATWKFYSKVLDTVTSGDNLCLSAPALCMK